MSRTRPPGADPTQLVRTLATAHDIPIDEVQLGALLAYGELLLRWGARINLTGARSLPALIDEHFPDAFALARLLPRPDRVVDVGSGGGLPALPLALLRPALSIALYEPIAKKVAFLRTAIRELALGGRVAVHPARAETLVTRTESITAHGPRTFDVAMSRATLPLAEWLALGRHLVREGGRVLALATIAGAETVVAPGDRQHLYLDGRRVVIERIVPRETSAAASPAPSEREV